MAALIGHTLSSVELPLQQRYSCGTAARECIYMFYIADACRPQDRLCAKNRMNRRNKLVAEDRRQIHERLLQPSITASELPLKSSAWARQRGTGPAATPNWADGALEIAEQPDQPSVPCLPMHSQHKCAFLPASSISAARSDIPCGLSCAVLSAPCGRQRCWSAHESLKRAHACAVYRPVCSPNPSCCCTPPAAATASQLLWRCGQRSARRLWCG